METCPECHRPLSLNRRRCYLCWPGRKRTGEERTCAVCGKPFYAPGWVIRDTARNSGTYCSRACKHAGMTGRELVVGTTSVQRGYRWVKVGIRKRKLEHRIVMEAYLGRPLGRREEIHHINGDKLDNRPDNLLVLSPSEHQKHHPEFGPRMRRRITLTCELCGLVFERRPKLAGQRFCSRSCRSKATQAMVAARRAAT